MRYKGNSKITVRPEGAVDTCKSHKKKKLIRVPNTESYQQRCFKAREYDWIIYRKIANAPRLNLSASSLWIRRKSVVDLKTIENT